MDESEFDLLLSSHLLDQIVNFPPVLKNLRSQQDREYRHVDLDTFLYMGLCRRLPSILYSRYCSMYSTRKDSTSIDGTRALPQ